MFSIKDGSFNGRVKLVAKETKWASLEVRTQHTFLENLISKYDTGPIKLPGLSRNGPLENLESPGILLGHFPGLESAGKRSLVLESSGNLLNSSKKYEVYVRQ